MRAAWWCLAAWPATFLLLVVIAQLLYPEGAVDPTGPGGSAVFGLLAAVALLLPPLATLVLSTVAFRRSRTWRDLIPAWILLAVVAVWDVLFAREVGNWSDVNWWVFSPTVVLVVALVAGIWWPRRGGRAGS